MLAGPPSTRGRHRAQGGRQLVGPEAFEFLSGREIRLFSGQLAPQASSSSRRSLAVALWVGQKTSSPVASERADRHWKTCLDPAHPATRTRDMRLCTLRHAIRETCVRSKPGPACLLAAQVPSTRSPSRCGDPARVGLLITPHHRPLHRPPSHPPGPVPVLALVQHVSVCLSVCLSRSLVRLQRRV